MNEQEITAENEDNEKREALSANADETTFCDLGSENGQSRSELAAERLAESLGAEYEKSALNREERQEESEPRKEEKKTAKYYFKKFVNRYFITAFSGMALGLFCTLIAGTIIGQIGTLIGNNKVGKIIQYIGTAAKMIMGAGIGVGIAHSFKAKKLTTFSAAAAGMLGANMTNIFVLSGIKVWGATGGGIGIGDPVASYVASVAAIEVCSLIEGKTPVDIIVIPLAAMLAGSAGAIVLGIPFGMLFALLGRGISHAISWEPISFGIIVAVVMGLLLTFPTSSAAFGVMLFSPLAGTSLQGASELAAAAACAGCCAHMVGFAVASFRENKWGGLVSQGIGTSMLQIPNLAKNMLILVPAIAASVVAGPLTSAVFGLRCNYTGSGMGTAGLVGVFGTISASHAAGLAAWRIALGIAVCYFIVPAVVALLTSELMRKYKVIKFGDMLLPK